jgi:hypothetical protein
MPMFPSFILFSVRIDSVGGGFPPQVNLRIMPSYLMTVHAPQVDHLAPGRPRDFSIAMDFCLSPRRMLEDTIGFRFGYLSPYRRCGHTLVLGEITWSAMVEERGTHGAH